MLKPHTSCNNCTFLVKEKEQVGCLAGRLDKFPKTMSDGGFYILEGICNMWRDKSLDPESTIQELLQDQRDYVRPKVTYFVISGGNLDELTNTLNSLPLDAEVLIADTSPTLLPSLLLDFDLKISIVNLFDQEYSVDKFLEETYLKTPKSLTCVVQAGYNIPEGLEDDLDHKLNVELSKKILFEYENCFVTYSEVGKRLGFTNLLEKLKGVKL
jgi:hypothetical protein